MAADPDGITDVIIALELVQNELRTFTFYGMPAEIDAEAWEAVVNLTSALRGRVQHLRKPRALTTERRTERRTTERRSGLERRDSTAVMDLDR